MAESAATASAKNSTTPHPARRPLGPMSIRYGVIIVCTPSTARGKQEFMAASVRYANADAAYQRLIAARYQTGGPRTACTVSARWRRTHKASALYIRCRD